MFRNKIPETLKPGCLCNGMKTPEARRLSINFAENLEERVSGDLSIRVEPKEVTPIALTRELLAV
jgi:hypothetical protein